MTIHGADYGYLGYRSAGVGDVNGDGYDDFLLGAPYKDFYDQAPGEVYLFLGGPAGWTGTADTSAADATLVGPVGGDYVGFDMDGGGDLDGDGLHDMVIGAPNHSGPEIDCGAAYVVFGRTTGWTSPMDLSATASFVGATQFESAGFAVSLAPDVDGDGLDDLLLGSPSGHAAGQAYVVLGTTSPWQAFVPLSSVDASFHGESSGDGAGQTVAGLGDVNGDGFGDLAIGAGSSHAGGEYLGEFYLVFGATSGWAMDTSLAGADASFVGENTRDFLAGFSNGSNLSGAGDVNGDGLADLLVAARHNDEGSEDAGQVYLVLGRTTGWTMGASIATADASFFGKSTEDYAGFVRPAGDVDADGLDDFLVGAYQNDDYGDCSGHAYLFHGKTGGWAMDQSLASADASFLGTLPSEAVGTAIAGAGDIDADGLDDFLIGASGNEDAGTETGAVYLFMGGGPYGDDDDTADDDTGDDDAADDDTADDDTSDDDIDGDDDTTQGSPAEEPDEGGLHCQCRAATEATLPFGASPALWLLLAAAWFHGRRR